MKIMNEKLTVKNFGPIKDVELDLKKVTIFIGPQGSGKSTLAKLVAICKEVEKPLLLTAPKNAENRIVDFGLSSYVNTNTYVNYISKISSIEFQNGNFTRKNSDLGEKINEEIFHLNLKLNDAIFLNKNHSKSTTLTYYDKYFEIIRKNQIVECMYIPENRASVSFLSSSLFGFMSNNVNLPKILTEFGNVYSIASAFDEEKPLQFLQESESSRIGSIKQIELFDLKFQHRNGQDFLIDSRNNYEVNLKDSASGMQSSIPLILVIQYSFRSKDKHFIIEEPELNLFPTTQKQLIGYLADKCTQNGNELLMTTHSPYVLSAINNLIFAYKVAHEVPEKAEEVAKIIPREQWLNPEDVAAYYVADGTIKSIIDGGEGLIGENELDAISEDISGERDRLFKILKSKKRETVY